MRHYIETDADLDVAITIDGVEYYEEQNCSIDLEIYETEETIVAKVVAIYAADGRQLSLIDVRLSDIRNVEQMWAQDFYAHESYMDSIEMDNELYYE